MSPEPRTPTPLDEPAMLAELAAAHEAERGAPAPDEVLRGIGAIVAVENAHGRALNNHNWGNLMAGPEWRETRPHWPGTTRDPNQPTFFRSYPSHRAGARALWELLYRRYPAVIAAAASGHGTRIATALYTEQPQPDGARGFRFVSPRRASEPREYAAALEDIATRYRREGVTAGRPTDAWTAALATIIGASAAGLAAWKGAA